MTLHLATQQNIAAPVLVNGFRFQTLTVSNAPLTGVLAGISVTYFAGNLASDGSFTPVGDARTLNLDATQCAAMMVANTGGFMAMSALIDQTIMQNEGVTGTIS